MAGIGTIVHGWYSAFFQNLAVSWMWEWGAVDFSCWVHVDTYLWRPLLARSSSPWEWTTLTQILSYSLGWPRTHCVAQNGLEAMTIFLLQLPESGITDINQHTGSKDGQVWHRWDAFWCTEMLYLGYYPSHHLDIHGSRITIAGHFTVEILIFPPTAENLTGPAHSSPLWILDQNVGWGCVCLSL